MTIFQLALIVCETVRSSNGLPDQQTCRWQPDQYFASDGRCGDVGRDKIGERVFSFSVVVGSDGEHVTGYQCHPVDVIE